VAAGRRDAVARAHRVAIGLATFATGALLLAACGGAATPPAKTGATGTSMKAGKVASGGTLTWAEGAGAPPNYIFPMTPFAYFSAPNLSDFIPLMVRPLYDFGASGQATVDYRFSVGKPPVFSNGDRTVTIKLNHYMWSNGTPVTAGDVIFWMNMLKAEKANWAGYVKGDFPDNVVSYSAPNPSTVVLRLNQAYNPSWFLYNELSQITPMPTAWDVTGPGDKGTCSTTTTSIVGCAAVYNYLTKDATQISTYTTSPLWTIIDGPWKLASFTSAGQVTFVPNPNYTGPDKPHLSKFVELPFSSETAEFNVLRSGPSNLSVGYIPPEDLPQRSTIDASGYDSQVDYTFGFNYIVVNFKNPTAGPILSQLYVRQALQHLIDQQGWISAFYGDAATPTYGPVPLLPRNPFIDSYERADPYPFSLGDAAQLLSSHGWHVVRNGQTTCIDPSRCGVGIARGAPLQLQVLYASGVTPLSNSMVNFQSEAAAVGIKLSLKVESFNAVIGQATATNANWELATWGAGWGYGPDYLPTGGEILATGAGSNSGSYSSATMDHLIELTHTAPAATAQQALDAYQNFAAKELPVLYQPAAGNVIAVAKDVGGYIYPPEGYITPEAWYLMK